MTGTLVDSPEFTVNEVYQISATEAVQGSAVGASFNGIGVANQQAQQLANRTALLRQWLLQEPFYAVDTGTTNAVSITLSIANNATFGTAPVSYASLQGVLLNVIIQHTNTGAATLSVNGLAPIPIVNPDDSALLPAQLTAGFPVLLSVFSGNIAILMGGSRNPEFTTVTASSGMTSQNGNITAALGKVRAQIGAFNSADPNCATLLEDFTIASNSSYVFQRLPSGLILQSGVLVNSTGQDTIAFPNPFASVCVNVFAAEGAPTGSWVSGNVPTLFATQSFTIQGFGLFVMHWTGAGWAFVGGITTRWFAIGI